MLISFVSYLQQDTAPYSHISKQQSSCIAVVSECTGVSMMIQPF